MCGIAGFFCTSGTLALERSSIQTIVEGMGNELYHRGPDSHGIWLDLDAGVAFSHQRLAIVDLTEAGQQPMQCATGRWTICFNGEIYNHQMLRNELEVQGHAPSWRGNSDTETLLAAVVAWGIEGTLNKAVGMFACALFDRRDRKLILARDRMGEKPLYYGWAEGTLVFGSELRALYKFPSLPMELDMTAVQMLLRFNYIPDPLSIFQGIRKLPAGHLVTIVKGKREADPRPYWTYADGARMGAAEPIDLQAASVANHLETTLSSAISGQLMSDVPLGALLSGGIDSSLVVALAQQRSEHPLKTFTIAFKEQDFNESHYARAVATHLGTDHHELELDSAAALDLVTELPNIFDEPFADPSQLPSYLVSKLARETVTVALSGDGADEIFGGYSRYQAAPAMWRKVRHLPSGLRRQVGHALSAAPGSLVGRRGRRIADALRQDHGIDGIYLSSLTQNPLATQLCKGSAIPPPLLLDTQSWPLNGMDAPRFMALDAITYLPGDLMTKVDRASMAVSLETRAPYLDRDVVELAWRIPQDMKIRKGQTKWILRQILGKYLPQSLIDRPKMGFGMPIAEWLRGPLRDLVETYLSRERLSDHGLFDVEVALQIWGRHKSGQEDNANAIWSLLMLQLWIEALKSRRLTAPQPSITGVG